jgi:hypothetical protein
MGINPPTPPEQPDIGNASTYNARALAWFSYLGGEFRTFLQNIDANDFFSVQSTLTDTTVNRLMKVGAFGLGGSMIEFGGNVNNPADLPNGYYRVLGSATGTKPEGITAFNLVILRRGASPHGNTTQVAMTPNDMFFREFDGASWTPWLRHTHSGNIVGTVSFSGGVNTGAPMQAGEGPNGEWERYASGEQVCRHLISISNVNVATGNIFSTAAEVDWTFPAQFLNATGVVCGMPGVRAAGVLWGRGRTISGSSGKLRLMSATSLPGPYLCEVEAHGRWR